MADKKSSEVAAQEEFLALFASSQRSLHAYILALVLDPNVAADILQETNIVLWQKFDQFQSGTNFFAWAREIARISVLRHRQSTSSRIALVDPEVLDSLAIKLAEQAPTLIDERQEALDECLKKLEDSDRKLILARYEPGASVAAMAEVLTRPTNSVSQSLSRIRRSLLECTNRRLRSVGSG